MGQPWHCSECMTTVAPGGWPHALCPRCMMAAGLDGGSRDGTGTAAQSAGNPTQIGDYRILEKLGEGGMGEVFAAQQDRPIRRKVALKLIKEGMDSRQIIARFESERQALALMTHPCIARVFHNANGILGSEKATRQFSNPQTRSPMKKWGLTLKLRPTISATG